MKKYIYLGLIFLLMTVTHFKAKADFSFTANGYTFTCLDDAIGVSNHIDLTLCTGLIEEVTVVANTTVQISWIAYENTGAAPVAIGDYVILTNGSGGGTGTVIVCPCCNSDPCTCQKCTICNGVLNNSSSGCSPCSCCPSFGNLIVSDVFNSGRQVSQGGTLKMVQANGTRSAYCSLSLLDFTPNNYYPEWSQPSSTIGTTATFSFPNSGGVSVKSGPTCQPLTASVEIVASDQSSLSGKLNVINNSLFALSQNIKSVLSPLSSDIGVQLELNGSGIIKNVDKYNDGANIGRYIDMSLGASGGVSLPEVKTPGIPLGPFTVEGKFKMGLVSLSGSVNGTYDESQSNPGNITGEVVFNFANPEVTASLIFGNPNLICAEASGTVVSSGMEIKGVFSFSNHTLKVTPMYSISQIKGIIAIGVKSELLGLECAILDDEYVFFTGNNGSESAITLYTFEQ